jgi:hypothetical protein
LEKEKRVCGEYVMRLMHSRTNAHIQHLQTKNYAAHVALQGYYEGVVGLVDRFVEAYQGVYGIKDDYPTAYTLETDPVKMLTELRSWIERNRADVVDEEDLQSVIDDTLEFIAASLYKLKFLS